VVSLCAPVLADTAYFDAAKYDWQAWPLEMDWALVVVDARIEAQSNVEVSITSGTWGTVLHNHDLGGSPWEGLVTVPPYLIRDGAEFGQAGHDVKITVGNMYFTPLTRDYPTWAPITIWETLETDERGEPLAMGSIEQYLAKGFVAVYAPLSTDSFFHSPASASVSGVEYLDYSTSPDFTGLPAVPEPCTAALLTACAAALLARRRRR